jgi:prepilin-type processing-associated H-X9-DG protein
VRGQPACWVGVRSSARSAYPITDGTSQTYLLGEKTLNPDYWLTGQDGSDDQGALVGDDDDIVRWTAILGPNPSYYLPPYQDLPGYAGTPGTNDDGFGSAHAQGFNMALCDGSVRAINYSIDPETHRRLGNRKDGLVIDAKKW